MLLLWIPERIFENAKRKTFDHVYHFKRIISTDRYTQLKRLGMFYMFPMVVWNKSKHYPRSLANF